MDTEALAQLLTNCSRDLWASVAQPASAPARGACLALPLLERGAGRRDALSQEQWQHVVSCRFCAGALAGFRQAAAAVGVALDSEALFMPLSGFPVTGVLAQAAAADAVEGVQRGVVDFVMPAPVPLGTTVVALEVEQTVTVVVPCEGPYAQNAPRIELLLKGGEVRTLAPQRERRRVRQTPGDPGSRRRMECWVTHFGDVPPGPMLTLIAPAWRSSTG